MARIQAKRYNVVILSAMSLLLLGSDGFTLDNGLARVPYMGWNTWYCNGDGWANYSLDELKAEADALVSTGLRDLGYRIVWLDGGWANARNADGTINPRFNLADFCTYVHSKGLLAGIYTDTSPNDGYGQPFGSGTHEKADMDTFVAMGFDAVKVDSKGGPDQWQYERFRDAIADRMIFNICTWGARGSVLTWGPQVGHAWRTGLDINSGYFVNMDANMIKPELTGPGAYNDPDYMNGRLGPDLNKGQFSMWAMMSSPLILGFKASTADTSVMNIYKNEEIIAIDQDSLCYQCRIVPTVGSYEIYKKNLTGGSIAVAFLFRGAGGVNHNSGNVCTFTPVATSKIRLLITKTGNDGGTTSPSISELRIFSGSSSNLALGKTASASSAWDANYVASKANDGDTNTRWNAANGAGDGEWLEIDLGTNTTCDKVIFEQVYNRIVSYSVQFWNGTIWSDVVKTTPDSSGTDDATVSWSSLGINGKYRVRDLWKHADMGTADGSYTAKNVQSEGGCVIVKMTPESAASVDRAPGKSLEITRFHEYRLAVNGGKLSVPNAFRNKETGIAVYDMKGKLLQKSLVNKSFIDLREQFGFAQGAYIVTFHRQ